MAKDWVELIKDPIHLSGSEQRAFQHSQLPTVNDALSITFRIKLKAHTNNWGTILHKGKFVVSEVIFIELAFLIYARSLLTNYEFRHRKLRPYSRTLAISELIPSVASFHWQLE